MPTDRFSVRLDTERFPIRGQFRISRGSKTEAEVVVCTLERGGNIGRGECVPYHRYGETIDSVVEQLSSISIDALDDPQIDPRALLPAGAARNALDCALWDWRAKASGTPAHVSACRIPPRPVPTAITISLDTPIRMAEAARAVSDRPLIKIKVGAGNDIACMHAVAGAAPNSRIIVDANEAWTEANIVEHMRAAAEVHIALIEQPLPAGSDAILGEIPHPVPICADESVHTIDDLVRLRRLYDAVNIKLDKAGGLTEALELRDRARDLGFGIMVGCMLGTSLGMAPAVLLAQHADYVDLDGPLLLDRDRVPGLTYVGSLVSPPGPDVWG